MKSQRYYWLKLHDDFFTDNSIKRLRKLAGGDTFTIIYLKLLLLSLKSDGKLYYEGLEEDFATQVALEMDEEADNVKVTLSYLMSRGILIQNTEEEYELTTQKEMVGSESESARRMRRTRQLQKDVKISLPSESESAQCAHNVQDGSHNVTLEIRDKREEIIEENNINNNIVAKVSQPPARTRKTIPPTIDEVREYCESHGYNIDPQHFIDYYTANGWMVGKNKMKDWQAAVRTWVANDTKRGGTNRGYTGNASSGNQRRTDIPHVSGVPLD